MMEEYEDKIKILDYYKYIIFKKKGKKMINNVSCQRFRNEFIYIYYLRLNRSIYLIIISFVILILIFYIY